MTPGKLDLTFYRDSTEGLVFTATDENQAPINLDGYTILMQVRKTIADVLPVVEYSSINGKLSITDSVAGEATLQLTVDDTHALPPGKMIYGIRYVSYDESFSEVLVAGVLNVLNSTVR